MSDFTVRWRRRGGALAGGIALSFLSCTGASGAAGHPVDGPFSGAQPVNVVILADESGSVAGAIQAEREAALQIVEEEWSPRSQIAVYGFGSAPPVRGALPAEAVDQYCGLTELTGPAARSTLAGCANGIRLRSQDQGYNTDFAAALNQAENVLRAPEPVRRMPIVFILTDGQLDVGPNSPYSGWPSSAAAGRASAQDMLSSSILPGLKSLGAQIWPVGFGQADRGELGQFARGGAQANPQCPAGTGGGGPSVSIVPPEVTGPQESQDIQQSLLGAFAAARCGAIESTIWHPLPPGSSITVPVTIYPLTTFGSIVVHKGDPRVVVTYTDPDGRALSDNTAKAQATGTLGRADYILTNGGPQSPLESLRLDGPPPGRWRVTFTNPPGLAAQTVGVSVVWQGEVQPELTFSPQIGDPGHPLRIHVRPAAGSAPVPASELTGFTVDLTVLWSAAGPPQQVRAVLDAAAGEFTGTVQVPQGLNGTAEITAVARARGVQGAAGKVITVRPGGGLNVGLDLPRGTRVAPGGTVSGVAEVDNQQLPPTDIVFSLGDLGDGVNASISAPSGTVHIPSGRTSLPVTIRFGNPTRLGPALGTIRWAVVGGGAVTPADWQQVAYLDVNVEYPPTPVWQQWRFWMPLALVVVGLTGLLLALRRRRDRTRRDVRHAGIALIWPGGPARVPYLRWTRGFTDVRLFDVDRATTKTPVLRETTESGQGLLELRRDPADRALTLAVRRAGELVKPKLDTPFAPPAGAGLNGCRLVLTELPTKLGRNDAHPAYQVPPDAVPPIGGDFMPAQGHGAAIPISLGEEGISPDRIILDDGLTGNDASTAQQKGT